MLNKNDNSMESTMYVYDFPEKLVLAAYSDHINRRMRNSDNDQKMEMLSELCLDGLSDPALESVFVLNYLDRYYETFSKDLEVKFY